MDKFTQQVSILFGLVFCLNGYSFNEEMCFPVKSNTNGTLKCPDDKSINIKQIGVANNSCSSDAFLVRKKLSRLKSITCYNRSICTVPFRHPSYNFLNIGFQCIEEMCVSVKSNTTRTLQCPDDKSINIKQIGFANNSCSSDAFLFPQNLSRLQIITFYNRSMCTVPFRHTSYKFLNIGFRCKADNDTDRRFNESGHYHDNSKYTSNHDHRNHTSDHDAGNQNHTLINVNSSQTHTPDHNCGNLTHTTDHVSTIRTHIADHVKSIPTRSTYYYSSYRTHTLGHVRSIPTHTQDHDSSDRTHTTDDYNDNQTPTPDHDNGNRTHTTEHDNGNRIYTTVFQTMKKPCLVCSTDEKCLTVQKDTENNITCNNDQRINISMAWVGKSDCNDIQFIAKNVINRTKIVSDLCSGQFNCRISYYSSVVGVLNILYFCNDRRLSLDQMNKSSNEQIIGAIAGGVTVILIAVLLIGVFMFRRCRNKNYLESNHRSDRKTVKTRSNPMYDPNELQEDQEVNNQIPNLTKSPHNTSVYSMGTNYDYIQSNEDTGNNYTTGRDTNYTYKRDSSAYDHIQNRDGMRNQETKTMETNVYSHLNGSVPASDAIYDHTMRDGIRDNCEGDYDVSHGIMTDDDYDVSGNFNQSQVKKSDTLYN